MKAIVQDEYGSPDTLRLTEIDRPEIDDDGVLVRSCALRRLRDKGQVQSGQKVLVNGASGGVGTFAVQIAKSIGADVAGACSTRNLELVRSIGANDAIDYTREDFTRNGERYEVILDAVGNRSLSDFRRVLGPDGTLVLAAAADGNWIGPLARPVKAVAVSPFVSQKLVPFLARHSKEDLLALTELIEAGQVTPLIDRTYPLSDAPKAIRYLETRRARGKVVITLARSS